MLIDGGVGLSNAPFLLGLAGKNVNCDVYDDDGGHDSNGRGHHSMFLCANCGDACLRLY
jgi:hypothetical protein